jgi:glucan phosphoethanolaminetransferase (alkaline phosphatase superfamily)
MFPLIRSYMVNIFIHGILSIASFAIAFVGASDLIERGKTAVFGVLLFAVLYIILAVIRCVYHFATTKKENEQKSYANLYTPTNVD